MYCKMNIQNVIIKIMGKENLSLNILWLYTIYIIYINY